MEGARVSESFRARRIEIVQLFKVMMDLSVHHHYQYQSFFKYVTCEFRLTRDEAYPLIKVAKKARELKKFDFELQNGSMTFTNAKKIASVINSENEEDMIKMACTMTSRKLEKEIARIFPGKTRQDRITYVSADVVRLQVDLFERTMLDLRRAQDLYSEKVGYRSNLSDTLNFLINEYLNRADPLRKSKRQVCKTSSCTRSNAEDVVARQKSETSKNVRSAIPAIIQHQVRVRDNQSCQFDALIPGSPICDAKTDLEIHHITPVEEGGSNELSNLILICRDHHRKMIHGRFNPRNNEKIRAGPEMAAN